MSEGFRNPIIGGGGALVYPSIHSPNFVHGSAGWTINKDGSAEFNNLTIRNGQIISGSALYYSGIPAAGNLVASIAAAAGTDLFGNAYLAGESSYTTVAPFVAINIFQSVITFYTASSQAGPWTRSLAEGLYEPAITSMGLLAVDPGGFVLGPGPKEFWIPPSGDNTGATDVANLNTVFALGNSTVNLVPGIYYINAPITLPTGAVLQGASGFGNPSANFGKGPLALGSTVIKATAGFAGAGMITMASAGSQTGGQRISGLALDGSAGPGGITGIQAIGAVAQVKLRDIAVYGGAGHLLTYGLLLNSNADGNPDAWDVDGCAFQLCATAGVGILAGVADSFWRNVSCTASAGDAWKIINGKSSRFLFCKGETSTGFGFNIQGVAGFTGFAHFIGCSGEGNTAGDFSVSGTGTGTFYLDFCHAACATPWTYAGTNNVRTPAAYNVSTVAPTLN